ncbi:bifunctional phosphoglucose/phosphomannose isomerase [Candidatus Saccharibacteria bacterium RIFCSPHIGHO2_01_FULL_49_21]|nr:MAG: bifunctional phosphoglucose/phosphomannose isomerase [Candidatus Saccharibacteria bacterium RIFCSPHIGHO2_01_FULL_49_21]
MLDDLKYIHQRDSQDALGIAEKQWQQLQHTFEVPDIGGNYENIVYAGMGGSALAGYLSISWPGYKLPFEICRQYHIPAYVSQKTLFIASSYSGNTEEVLSALAEAEQRGAKIIIISYDGELHEIAKRKSYPYLSIPKTQQPRYSVLYNLKALVSVLEKAGLTDDQTAETQMGAAAAFLGDSVASWLPTVSTETNPAKKLAMELAGKSPVIYAGPLLAPVAYKWKININENAKNVAWWNQLPEFNHNEFIGWSAQPIEKPYAVVDLRSNLENERVQKRFEVTEKLLSGRRPSAHIVQAQGQDLLQQLVWTIAYGDFVSIYLGLINNVDPGPVDLVEKFKAELNK